MSLFNQTLLTNQSIMSSSKVYKGVCNILMDALLKADKYDEAIELLRQFVSRHEAGLLPDRFIYEQAKKFLDGQT